MILYKYELLNTIIIIKYQFINLQKYNIVNFNYNHYF